ncbi:hypothetical protein [Streptomyces sp. NPDC050287]|uniref:hypothetical protein n=1 Tax=Streptomyces sp. NPDC050287 TaxID=3365608 RepID=UPI0037B80D34
MSETVDVWAAAAEFDRSTVCEDQTAAEGDRKRVVDLLFPLEKWPTLPLEHYALGLNPSGATMTYCRFMEFGTPHLGSIKGGSAAKHIMYRHNSGEWRLAAPLRGMEPQNAWELLRAQFLQAFTAVAAGDFEAVDDLEVLRFGSALVTKSLATYFPEHFLPVYSADHLRKFLALLGGTSGADSPTWRSNRRVLRIDGPRRGLGTIHVLGIDTEAPPHEEAARLRTALSWPAGDQRGSGYGHPGTG